MVKIVCLSLFILIFNFLYYLGKVGIISATALLTANLSVSLAILLQLNLTTQVINISVIFVFDID